MWSKAQEKARFKWHNLSIDTVIRSQINERLRKCKLKWCAQVNLFDKYFHFSQVLSTVMKKLVISCEVNFLVSICRYCVCVLILEEILCETWPIEHIFPRWNIRSINFQDNNSLINQIYCINMENEVSRCYVVGYTMEFPFLLSRSLAH